MAIATTIDTLTNPLSKIAKTRYFSVELQCMDMIPNTQYDMYVDGIKMNAFCKPFGGNLGDPLIAGLNGKLLIQYHMAIPYNNQYLTVKPDEKGYKAKNQMIELRDPNGISSFTYLPIRMKANK